MSGPQAEEFPPPLRLRLLVLLVLFCSLSAGPAFAEGIRLFPRTLDLGWQRFSHGLALPAGASIELNAVGPCAAGEICDVAGPAGARRCDRSFEPCDSDADCNETPSETCRSVLLPPIPLREDATPVCIVVRAADDIEGTVDRGTGNTQVHVPANVEFVLGINQETPCPRCVPDSGSAVIGASGVCAGGENDGDRCEIAALTDAYGAMSYECPPSFALATRGPGLRTNWTLTTDSVVREARFPCRLFPEIHPLGDSPICMGARRLDACTSNEDCAVCEHDRTTPCESDSQCGDRNCESGAGAASACGLYCFTGRCANESRLSCIADEDCGDAGPCTPGEPEFTQERPNACDSLHCGAVEAGMCSPEAPVLRSASDVPECFGNRIFRNGIPAAPGYGAIGPFGLVGVFALGSTVSPAIDAVFGLPGPVAISFDVDSTFSGGGGTTTTTLANGGSLCGDSDGDGEITVRDALFMLRVILTLDICPSCVCDVDVSGSVTAADVLRILSFAVGLDVELVCSLCGAPRFGRRSKTVAQLADSN